MEVMEKREAGSKAGAREYLTFRLGQEEYGIDILKVQEIRGYEKPTRIANAPHFINISQTIFHNNPGHIMTLLTVGIGARFTHVPIVFHIIF